MPAWIPITLAAAFLQNLRSSLQARLRGRVGPTGAVFVRFIYALPVAAALALGVFAFEGAAPEPTGPWAGWAALGATTQILATGALLAAAPRAGFAIATGYSKTEPILATLAGALLLAELPPELAIGGIGIGVLGVWLATQKPGAAAQGGALRTGLLYGVGSAALFGLSAVSYRAAALGLESGSVAARAALTLIAATAAQSAAMALFMGLRAPRELRDVFRAWRPGFAAGAAGALASFGWFAAMTLEPAAHVRALAQVELLFAAATGWAWFSERPTPRGLVGLGLIGLGAALLLIATA